MSDPMIERLEGLLSDMAAENSRLRAALMAAPAHATRTAKELHKTRGDLLSSWQERDAERHENARLRAEVSSLRASLGEPTGAEPVGCPCPGACSAVTAGYFWVIERAAARARDEREELPTDKGEMS